MSGKSIDKNGSELNLHLLKEVPIFADLTEDQLDKVMGIISRESFSKGSVIIQEGEEGNTMYILEKGTVEVSKTLTLKVSRHDLGRMEKTLIKLKGDEHPFFGEMALLESDERSATITAGEDSELLVIEREDFERLCEEFPEIGYKLIMNISKVLCSRIRKANRDISKLTTALSFALKG